MTLIDERLSLLCLTLLTLIYQRLTLLCLISLVLADCLLQSPSLAPCRTSDVAFGLAIRPLLVLAALLG